MAKQEVNRILLHNRAKHGLAQKISKNTYVINNGMGDFLLRETTTGTQLAETTTGTALTES